jgi:hypothetical protein
VSSDLPPWMLAPTRCSAWISGALRSYEANPDASTAPTGSSITSIYLEAIYVNHQILTSCQQAANALLRRKTSRRRSKPPTTTSASSCDAASTTSKRTMTARASASNGSTAASPRCGSSAPSFSSSYKSTWNTVSTTATAAVLPRQPRPTSR